MTGSPMAANDLCKSPKPAALSAGFGTSCASCHGASAATAPDLARVDYNAMSAKLFKLETRSADTTYNPKHLYDAKAYSDTDLQNDYAYLAYDSVCAPKAKEEMEGIVTVGYCGVRAVGRERGTKWGNESLYKKSGDCGDDRELLRAVTYGNGMWVAVGFWFTASVDGVNWTSPLALDTVTSRECVTPAGGLAFGNGKFLLECPNEDKVFESSDGLDWTQIKLTGSKADTGGHQQMFFDPATKKFVVTGDNKKTWVSADGAAWEQIQVETARLCSGGITPGAQCPSFWYDGLFLKSRWAAGVERSTDGKAWTAVSLVHGNPYNDYSFAVGKVAKQ
jgi:cytochrome c553